MIQAVIRTAVRARFACTSRRGADREARRQLAGYLALAETVDAERGVRPVRVPPMPGIDPDMREWSFFMILEHDAIVNRSISAVVQALARGERPVGAGAIDPKHDVMPSPEAGPEQVAAFRSSVEDHLAAVAGLGPLRGGRTWPHPVFGDFDAHRWHCMFGFHLALHLRQARHVAGRV
jgi:hypothetical protein